MPTQAAATDDSMVRVHIPMDSAVESLNAAVAGSAIMYAAHHALLT